MWLRPRGHGVIWAFHEFPRGHLRLSRKSFSATSTFFLEIFLEISTHTPSQIFRTVHVRYPKNFDVGPNQKSQYRPRRPSPATRVTHTKSLILTKTGLFWAKFSSPAAAEHHSGLQSATARAYPGKFCSQFLPEHAYFRGNFRKCESAGGTLFPKEFLEICGKPKG